MQETFYQTADAEVSLSDTGAGDNLSDRGCRKYSIRQRMQESLYQTVDVEVSLSDSGGRSLSIRQRMQKSLYQTADAEVSLSDSGYRRHSIRQRLHLIECLLHPLSDRETSASASAV